MFLLIHVVTVSSALFFVLVELLQLELMSVQYVTELIFKK